MLVLHKYSKQVILKYDCLVQNYPFAPCQVVNVWDPKIRDWFLFNPIKKYFLMKRIYKAISVIYTLVWVNSLAPSREQSVMGPKEGEL